MPVKYKEIIILYEYCKKLGIPITLKPMIDGYTIIFNNGSGDVIQHFGSYGCNSGCVEPAIGSRLDYTAVELKDAKRLIRRHKDRLIKERKNENT